MAGTNLGKAWVQIVPSAQDLPGDLNRMFGGASEEAGKSSGIKIGGAIKKAIAAAGIGVALKKTLDAGGEMQQNLGGTEAVFGDFAEKIQKKATKAYKNMGLSASDYMATANKMGSLFQGSGVEQKKALDMTASAMQRAADVASVMGLDTSMAMESIAGAAKGNFTMMDNLGVAMNATTLEAYALEKGVNFKWNTASNAEKAELAMQMFMDRTSQYEGNFARESEETFSGSIGAMQAALENLMANLSMGENVGPAMSALAKSASAFLFKNLIPMLGNVFKSLPEAISTFIQEAAPALKEHGTTLITNLVQGVREKVPELLARGGELLTNLYEGIKQELPELAQRAQEIVQNLGNSIREKLPIIAEKGGEILSMIGQAIKDHVPDLLDKGGDIIAGIYEGIGEKLPELAQKAIEIIKTVTASLSEKLPELAKKGGEFMVKIGQGIARNIPKVLTAFAKMVPKVLLAVGKLGLQILKSLGQLIPKVMAFAGQLIAGLVKGLGGSAISKVKGAVEKIKTALTGPIERAKEIFQGIIEKIKSFFPFNLGNIVKLKLPHISVSAGKAPWGIGGAGEPPHFGVTWNAKAAQNPYLFTGATLFGAGETTDEILYGRKALMRDIAAAQKGSGNVTINLNYDASEDAQDMLRDLSRGIKRYRMAGVI